MATNDEITSLLKRFRRLIDESKCKLVPRYYTKRDGTKITYIDALVELNITRDKAVSVVRSLQVSDYRKGPEEDRDKPLDGLCIWVFKTSIKGKTAYIKLKILDTALILSLHEDW